MSLTCISESEFVAAPEAAMRLAEEGTVYIGDPDDPTYVLVKLDGDEEGRRLANFLRLQQALAMAIRVFGSQEAAETWLREPAMGLNRRRPIDLLESAGGAELVETFLFRLEHGVYT